MSRWKSGGRLIVELSVQVDSCDNKCGANHEHDTQLEVGEYVQRDDGGHNDGHGCREAFQNVVGVLDNHGNQQATKGLHEDDEPDPIRVAVEEAMSKNGPPIVGKHAQKSDQSAEDAQLDVTHPHRDLCRSF